MLGNFFLLAGTLDRLQVGPVAPLLDSFSDWLADYGYSHNYICNLLTWVSRWSQYLADQGVSSIQELTIDLVEGFSDVCHNYSRMQHPKTMIMAVHRFQKYLEENEILMIQAQPRRQIVREYLDWMGNTKNASTSTLEIRERYLNLFLDQLEELHVAVKDLTSQQLIAYFLDYSQTHGIGARRSMQATLRTFFRFCLSGNYLNQDPGLVLPTPKDYRQAKVPKGIEADHAQNLIASVGLETKVDLRDRAILQLLTTYGVRGGQVCLLKLGDIDWRRATIRFPAHKRGLSVSQPLTDDVGECLLKYLLEGRPQTKVPEVFLTGKAPYKPMTRHTLSSMIRHRLKKAGIPCRPQGSHAFRHGFATRMLKEGQTLKTIADMLGHRHLRTTFQYTKIDFQALNPVALDWPEVIS
ncbi:MAG: site-specific integrase [Acidobacteriota bacterium]|nr:site-specific integrase [Acidobacteriota bacterium]